MKRLPLVLSAFDSVVPFAKQAGYAKNAGAVNGIKASKKPQAGRLVTLGKNGTFPPSVGQAGPTGPTGPTGPAGAAGSQGAKGDTGATGAAGATNVVERFGTGVVVQSNQSGTAFATCKAGEHVTGGGFFDQGPVVEASRPQPLVDGAPATGWSVSVFNTTNASMTIGAYVMCVSP